MKKQIKEKARPLRMPAKEAFIAAEQLTRGLRHPEGRRVMRSLVGWYSMLLEDVQPKPRRGKTPARRAVNLWKGK